MSAWSREKLQLAFPVGARVEHKETGRRGVVYHEIRHGLGGMGAVDWGPGDPPRVTASDGTRLAFTTLGYPPNVWHACAEELRRVYEREEVEPLCELLRGDS